jgi:hypothetical protein
MDIRITASGVWVVEESARVAAELEGRTEAERRMAIMALLLEWATRYREVPVGVVLFCPRCGEQHIDRPEPHREGCQALGFTGVDHRIAEVAHTGPERRLTEVACSCGRWENPPHRSHQCHHCSWVWRASDVPTEGIASPRTGGSRDNGPAILGRVLHRPTRHGHDQTLLGDTGNAPEEVDVKRGGGDGWA